MPRGKVKWFNSKKGYGYIWPDDEEFDEIVFVDQSHIDDHEELTEGETVEFDVVQTSGGPHATSVSRRPWRR